MSRGGGAGSKRARERGDDAGRRNEYKTGEGGLLLSTRSAADAGGGGEGEGVVGEEEESALRKRKASEVSEMSELELLRRLQCLAIQV